MKLYLAGRLENFLVDTGAAYTVLISYSETFSSQTCTIWGDTGKTITKKIHFVAGMDKYFPISFWCFLSVLLPYREESSPCLRNLAAIAVLIEDALKLSFEGKTNYFYQLPSETTPEWESPFMDVWSKILRYQVVLTENPDLTISPSEVINPTTLLPTPESSLPFCCCLETLDQWTKP